MSPLEVYYRIQQTAYTRTQRFGLFTGSRVPAPNISANGQGFLPGVRGVDVERYRCAAEQIINGHLSVFTLEETIQNTDRNWNRDPLTGVIAPLEFGKTLNYHDPAVVGDIKYLWEPNRHLHLVALAQTYYLTGEQRYLVVLKEQLDSWFEQCPVLLGPNWSSSLELAIRLINWSIVWTLIGGKDSSMFEGSVGSAFMRRWLDSVYQHAHFIHGHFSRYSSANNHLIGEAAGLFIACTTWPFWKVFDSYGQKAKEILECEALLQNSADGVNREQAIAYQQFVLDFLIIAGLQGKTNGCHFSKDYWQRIETMLEYVHALVDIAGNLPMIGDADDGYVVRLAQEQSFCPYKSLLATGAILFRRTDFRAKAGNIDDKTRWMLGDQAEQEFASLQQSKAVEPVQRAFPDGGYYILGNDFGGKNEVRVVVDAGPLGYQSIAAHGHADALAFTLTIAGHEFLVDPGTFSYHAQGEWRSYFRGTVAHNTVCVDGEDQSVTGGNFMWMTHAHTDCETWEPGLDVDRFVGVHDGYQRFSDPVIHRRELCLYKKESRLAVIDAIECKHRHKVERLWHFSEACHVSVEGDVVVVTNGPVSLRMWAHEKDTEIRICRGQESPPCGWISRRYDRKVPASTIIFHSVASGTLKLATEISWESAMH